MHTSPLAALGGKDTGGMNVYPVEVEQALSRTPGVRELAVFGVPDAEWGQRVCVAAVGDIVPGDVHQMMSSASTRISRWGLARPTVPGRACHSPAGQAVNCPSVDP